MSTRCWRSRRAARTRSRSRATGFTIRVVRLRATAKAVGCSPEPKVGAPVLDPTRLAATTGRKRALLVRPSRDYCSLFQLSRLRNVSEQSALIGEHINLLDLGHPDDWARALRRNVSVRLGL